MRWTAALCGLLLGFTGCYQEKGAQAPLSASEGVLIPPKAQPAPAGSLAPSNPGMLAPSVATPPAIPDWCKEPLTVQRLCSRAEAPCPASAEEVRAQACTNKFIWGSVHSNSCGGTSVITRIGNSGRTWDFDGTGALIALTSFDDVPFGPCQLNHYVYGKPCQLGQKLADLCGVADGDAGWIPAL